MIFIQQVRTNDVNDKTGSQVELGKNFMNAHQWTEGAISVNITFQSLTSSQSAFSNRKIQTEFTVRGNERGGTREGVDCKEYSHGDGFGPLKAFLRELDLKEDENYFILEDKGNKGVDFNLYAVDNSVSAIDLCQRFHQKMVFGIDELNIDGDKGPLQIIYYGAPGTGKSHYIDGVVTMDNSIRTTFHPDSDYASFVGAYKPSMEKDNVYALDATGKSHEVVYPEAHKQITYKFIPQAFLKAYVTAWKYYFEDNRRPFYLVIEEINRGNCAQIFGDLFQLLDRNKNGYSSYAIVPDTDIQNYLEDVAFAKLDISLFGEKIVNDDGKEIATIENIKNGLGMVLPPNLHIWATMNTSDQSLFPIDSAFKRRWDWKYMKIKDAGKYWKIDIIEKDNEQYDWWKFIEQINKIISNMTSSADKQLGYFFCKPDKMANENDVEPAIITTETFVGKVLFYLWNDVFKDYAYENKALFTFKDENLIEQDLSFPDFYKDDDQVNEEVVKQFLDHVMDWKSDNSADQQ